jgi:hypothetical protein
MVSYMSVQRLTYVNDSLSTAPAEYAQPRTRLPVTLEYYEACRSELKARLREKQLKTGFGRAYLKRRLNDYSEPPPATLRVAMRARLHRA